MIARKANDDSHFLFVPLPHKARDILNTTVEHATQKNHTSANFQLRVASCPVPRRGTHVGVNSALQLIEDSFSTLGRAA